MKRRPGTHLPDPPPAFGGKRVQNGTSLCQSPFLRAAGAPLLTQLAGQPRPALGAGTEPRDGVTRAAVLAEAALAAAPPVETHRARCGKSRHPSQNTGPKANTMPLVACQGDKRVVRYKTKPLLLAVRGRERSRQHPEAA